MSDGVLACAQRLTEAGLLGRMALRFGAPDRVMLLSGGPATHLARWSLLAAPARKRVVVRQPSRDLLPAAPPHSPLNGDLRLVSNAPPLRAEVEEWKHGSWYHCATLQASNLEDLFHKLKDHTSTEPFARTPPVALPQAPFWSGALAYDLVQWTQPIRLQHPPKEGALLAVLWQVEGGVVVQQESKTPSIFGNDEGWMIQAELAMDEPMAMPHHHHPMQTRESVTHTDETHQDNIEAVRQGIVRGQVYQVNIGKHWEGDIDHPLAVFHRLVNSNPAPFSAYVEAEDFGFALASSSPESLLTSDGDVIRTSPIKGTCPQGASEPESEALRNAMILDEKERAEHRMLVDLMRNDLTTIGQPGSIVVERFDVESYANVQHLVSHISANLADHATMATALQSIFPGGSITGCPRTVVCAVIDELEKMPRSFWTGSIGYIDVHQGRGGWNILIRTLEAHRSNTGWRAKVGAGGGITIASNPRKEVEEAAWKGAALRVAAGWMRQEHVALPTGTLSIHPIESQKNPPSRSRFGKIQRLEDARGDGTDTGVLFVDNLDSFSFNIANAVAQLGHNVTVMQGRWVDTHHLIQQEALLERLRALNPTHIILGPGPGTPSDCPLTLQLAEMALNAQLSCPVLGICLGHQALAQADGRRVIPSPHGPVHGVPTNIVHDNTGLFEHRSHTSMLLTRYNSLVVSDSGEHHLIQNAEEENTGLNMGLRHPTLPIHGLQIHPESVGSPDGLALIEAFLRISSDD
jgi:anthranilate synthase